MKKLALIVVAAFSVMSLSACSYFSSPEKQAFDAFVAKCKKDPSSPDCKAWEESKNSPGGN